MTVRLLPAAAAGVLLSAALPPSPWWPLLLALPVAFGLIASARGPGGAFWTGAAFAFAFFALYVLWLPASFSALLSPVFWLSYPLMLAILAAMWGGTAALARLVGRDGPGTLMVLPPLWVGVELLRGTGFFAFPWGTLGYAWLDTPVTQVADVVGVYGLSLLTAVLAALLAAPFVPGATGRAGPGRIGYASRPRRTAWRWSAPALAAALLAVAWWGGGVRGERVRNALPAPDLSALLVQGDTDPLGRSVGAEDDLDVYAELTASSVASLEIPPDLVVWPEGAVMGYPLDGVRGQPARASVQASAPEAGFVVGGRAQVEGGSANAVYALEEGTLLDRYDKQVLVPFGERWPLLEVATPVYRAIFGLLGLPLLQNTMPGSASHALDTAVGPVAAYVCYESVFPRIPRRMVADGAEVLVNVTNDAWFARGNGAQQHFDMGRMRAIETRRWLIRAGNDGITGSVDPVGDVQRRFERGARGALRVTFARREALTPYVRWGHLTPWAIGGLAILAALGTSLRRGA